MLVFRLLAGSAARMERECQAQPSRRPLRPHLLAPGRPPNHASPHGRQLPLGQRFVHPPSPGARQRHTGPSIGHAGRALVTRGWQGVVCYKAQP